MVTDSYSQKSIKQVILCFSSIRKPASGLTSAQVKKDFISLLNYKKVSKNPFLFPESRP